jgi:hypothetical protein
MADIDEEWKAFSSILTNLESGSNDTDPKALQ